MENPLISIIIPTKNRQKLVHRAIASVAAQDYGHLEIVVVDDGSNPELDLSDLIRSSGGRTVKLIRNDTSIGGAKSRNAGILNSEGAYIAFLDDDDIYYPNKITALYGELKSDASCDVAFGRTLLNDGTSKWHPIKYPEHFSKKKNIQLMNYIHTGSSLVRKERLNDIKFLESLTRYQDLQFYLELTVKSKIKFLDIDVCEWSVDDRPDQVTSNTGMKNKLASYEAFKSVTEYLKNELKLKPGAISQYELRTYILGVKAKKYISLISIILFLLNPIKVMCCLLDYVERKRIFNV